jgi:endoglucanase
MMPPHRPLSRLHRVSVVFGVLLGAAPAPENAAIPDTEPPHGALRVTHVGAVAPDVLGVTLQAGQIIYGDPVSYEKEDGDRIARQGHQRWVSRDGLYLGSLVGTDEKLVYTRDRYVGDTMDGTWADAARSYQVTSKDDPAYTKPRLPRVLGRKTKPIDIGRVGPQHAWQFRSPTETVVYLKLYKPLSEGKRYLLTFRGKLLAPVEFSFDTATLRSEAEHTSHVGLHVGFHPEDPVKVAFLSCWMGSGGGRSYKEGLAFRVLDARSRDRVFEGKARLSKAADDKTEDAYHCNYNGTDVFVLDFSPLRKEGSFVVSVSGVGCSYPFRVDREAWRDAFVVSARGFYHQRSGIPLGPPWTGFRRPRPFHPDDGVVVFSSTCRLMDSGNGLNYRGTDKDNFGNLVRGRTSEVVADAWGGYMDAGDWDRRIQHLIVSRYLIDLAALFPDFFAQVSLNILESRDDLPDVVCEALFNLDCYRRMQAESGGIRGGIESSEHPRAGEGSWQESLDILAYAPGLWSSHWYASVAAQAARFLRDRKPEMAEIYEESALRAMRFAEAEWSRLGDPKRKDGGVVDTRNVAAAELFRLTGDERWHHVFLETTAFGDPDAELFKWPEHEQRDAAWAYVQTQRPGVDARIQANCRAAILREADARVRQCYRTGFRWTKYEWAPSAWGALSAPDGLSLVRAHRLTGDERYLKAAILACQHGAGANPINLCYTTGIGPKYPLHPLHIDSRVTDQPPPPGLTVFGPMGYDQGKDEWGQKLANQVLFPPFEKWPTTEAYWDIFWYPPMCEFTVHQPMARNAYVWGYLAAVKR